MTTVSPLRATTLLTPQARSANSTLKAAVQKAVDHKAAEVKAMAARAAAPSPQGRAQPGQDRFDAYKDPASTIAAAEAAFAKWQAGEDQFAADNGFRRLVNSGLTGTYAHAKTGVFGTAAINTRKDMNDHLDRFITGFISDVALINQSGGGSLTVGDAFQGYVEKGLGERGTAVFLAKSQDHLDARRMTLYAETAYVQKSLGLPHPIVTEQDGQVRFTEQTITLHGKPFARIGMDGGLTLFARNPDPTHPDPVDLYLPLT